MYQDKLKPMFRADHVGSLKRPPRLLEARRMQKKNEKNAGALRALEDELIKDVVRRQEEIGLQVLTDGDFRRGAFHIDFLNRIGGISWDDMRFSHSFVAGGSEGESPAVFRELCGKVGDGVKKAA